MADGHEVVNFERVGFILLRGVVDFAAADSAFITACTDDHTDFAVGVLVLPAAVLVVSCFNHCCPAYSIVWVGVVGAYLGGVVLTTNPAPVEAGHPHLDMPPRGGGAAQPGYPKRRAWPAHTPPQAFKASVPRHHRLRGLARAG